MASTTSVLLVCTDMIMYVMLTPYDVSDYEHSWMVEYFIPWSSWFRSSIRPEKAMYHMSKTDERMVNTSDVNVSTTQGWYNDMIVRRPYALDPRFTPL